MILKKMAPDLPGQSCIRPTSCLLQAAAMFRPVFQKVVFVVSVQVIIDSN